MLDSRKQILILHASAGHGHQKAAAAVGEAYRRFRADADVEVIDALDKTRAFYGRGYARLYVFLIKRLAWLWGFFYHVLDLRAVDFFVHPWRQAWNRWAASPLADYLIARNPDVVVCTHFLPLEVCARLKRSARIHAALGAVITDCMPHAFWLERGVDFFAVAMPESKKELMRRGVPAAAVHVTGIPVEQKFGETLDREEILSELGLRTDHFTVLVTSGGAGVGSIRALVEKLARGGGDIQMLVVCGTNEPLRAELCAVAARYPGLRVFGFVDHMHRLMEASDLVIGKSGGLTLTESLCRKKPMVVIEPVPGQETRNADCIAKEGAAVVARSPKHAERLVRRLKSDAAEMLRLKIAAAALARPEAAAVVVELAERASKPR